MHELLVDSYSFFTQLSVRRKSFEFIRFCHVTILVKIYYIKKGAESRH